MVFEGGGGGWDGGGAGEEGEDAGVPKGGKNLIHLRERERERLCSRVF